MRKKIYDSFVKSVVLLACIATTIVLFSDCKTKPKMYRVGVLSGLDPMYPITDGFKEKMTELGYLEGKNISYNVQKSNVDFDAYKNILKKFVSDKVDLILTFPTEASIEAKTITQGTSIPVVFANVFTENTGLVNSVREPGGNMTGVRWVGPDMVLQRLEILRELAPKAKRIWVPYLKDYPIVKMQIESLHAACDAAGLSLTEIPAYNAMNLDTAFKKQVKASHTHPDAILQIIEPISIMSDAFLVMCKFAQKYKIPVGGVYLSIDGYESVFGLTPQPVPQGKQAAFLADKILKGANPGAIPVVSAEGYLQISYKAAVALGLTVSEGLLNKADEVIR